MVELLLSVDGDTTNGNGLQATKQVRSGSYAVLSFSSTVYLELWQTLYLMIRATGAGSFEVLEGSTFGVALIGKTFNYFCSLVKIRPCSRDKKRNHVTVV